MVLSIPSYGLAHKIPDSPRETRSEVSFVYMVTNADKNADAHIFVMSNLWRADGRRREVRTNMIGVKTN